MGCRLIQGYLVGRPLSRNAARSLLRQSLTAMDGNFNLSRQPPLTDPSEAGPLSPVSVPSN
jgi:hypothetical protein